MKPLMLFLCLLLTFTTQAKASAFPSAQLVTEEQRQVDFYADLVRGRLVAIQYIFTSCGMVCPMLGANFATAQRLVAEEGMSDARFISISVDPLRDTPEALRKWRDKFGGRAGNWTLVTGEKNRVDGLLKALEVFVADREDHSGFVLIGNEASGEWRRVNGLSGGAIIARTLQELR